MTVKIVGIMGSYRKGQIIDSAVTAVLEGTKAQGAQTNKTSLLDKHIEFCNNCRNCTQIQEAVRRGPCMHDDDMEAILTGIVNSEPEKLFVRLTSRCNSVILPACKFINTRD